MASKTLSRREALRAAALAAAGATLAACTPKTVEVPKEVTKEVVVKETVVVGATAAPKGPVTIKVQSGWCIPGSDIDVWTPIIDLFRGNNADIKVELVSTGANIEDMMTAMASGTASDLYHYYGSGDIQPLSSRGVVYVLDDLLVDSSIKVQDDYLPEQWAGVTWEGKIYGVPVLEAGANPAFSWHKRLLEEIGADGAAGPKNWAEVQAWAKELNKLDDAGNLTQMGFDPLNSWGCTVLNWTMAFDADYISKDKKTILFNQNENWATGLDIMASFWQEIGVDKVTAFRQEWGYWTGGKDTGFPNGKRAMVINGQWQPGELIKQETLADPSWEIGYGWLPCLNEGKKHVNFGQSHSLFMPKICQNPDEAFSFMEHMCSVQVNQLTYKIRGGFVWSRSLEQVLDVSDLPGMEFFLQMPGQADRIFSPADTGAPIGNEIERLWSRAVEEVTYGTKTAKAALDDITVELQKSLDDFYAASE